MAKKTLLSVFAEMQKDLNQTNVENMTVKWQTAKVYIFVIFEFFFFLELNDNLLFLH